MVRFLPQLRADDHADEVEHDQDDDPGQGVHERDVDLAEQREDGHEFKGDGGDPEDHGADAQALGVADGLGFFGFLLAGHGGSLFDFLLRLLRGFFGLLDGLLGLVSGLYDFFLGYFFSHVVSPEIKMPGKRELPRLRRL